MGAVADTGRGIVEAVIEIEAPPERVFVSLTDPVELASWWGAVEVYRTFDWDVDLRPGGSWSCKSENAAGQPSSVRGEYLAVEPPRLLETTWCASWDDFVETRVRYELEPTPAGTRLSVIHSGFARRTRSCREHAEGWTLVLSWLGDHLGGATWT
jgi:uncharacterized protein YndB with AHSA1/START domain